ncbi:hypothetical protein VNO80_10429 [Phaseolus coccineus]|uniref:Uncharacterized protein n=1 Tax=Phaseolus coccineus TaxID=3886 RepID=A0AAN9REM3_PHACN
MQNFDTVTGGKKNVDSNCDHSQSNPVQMTPPSNDGSNVIGDGHIRSLNLVTRKGRPRTRRLKSNLEKNEGRKRSTNRKYEPPIPNICINDGYNNLPMNPLSQAEDETRISVMAGTLPIQIEAQSDRHQCGGFLSLLTSVQSNVTTAEECAGGILNVDG